MNNSNVLQFTGREIPCARNWNMGRQIAGAIQQQNRFAGTTHKPTRNRKK